MKAVFCAGLKGRILYDCLQKIFGAFEKGGCMDADDVSRDKLAFFDIFSFSSARRRWVRRRGVGARTRRRKLKQDKSLRMMRTPTRLVSEFRNLFNKDNVDNVDNIEGTDNPDSTDNPDYNWMLL